MFGQNVGSIIAVLDAASKLPPDFFAWIWGCSVVAYIHYPTISVDMISSVESGEVLYNNAYFIATVPAIRNVKILYYRLFGYLYSFAGGYVDLAIANSSWTATHISTLWKTSLCTIYPPCQTSKLSNLTLGPRECMILSIAQFRPEKAHIKQIEIFHKFAQNYPDFGEVKLILLGGVRNHLDSERVAVLQKLVTSLALRSRVVFEVNASYDVLLSYLEKASIGISTMVNEHFGIGIVEYMAAGIIPVVHNSGGPRTDIVEHAKTGDRYTNCVLLNEQNFKRRVFSGGRRRVCGGLSKNPLP
ncbi:hypothetical protein BC829DRAFT_402018 [Chytridium lagenaria]|nr:hypothetical protein BC829DRAFT_402018 [Chytridium lagenaria]